MRERGRKRERERQRESIFRATTQHAHKHKERSEQYRQIMCQEECWRCDQRPWRAQSRRVLQPRTVRWVQDSSIPPSSASEPASRNPQRKASMSAGYKACQQLVQISVTHPLLCLSIFILLSPMRSALVGGYEPLPKLASIATKCMFSDGVDFRGLAYLANAGNPQTYRPHYTHLLCIRG